jgi:hypothetical protein
VMSNSNEFNRFFVNSDDLDTSGKIQLTNSINMKKMRVERFTFFNTAYNIDNKSLKFTESLVGVLTTTVAPLISGFYTITTLIAYLKTVLDSGSPNGWTYSLTMDLTTNKLTISGDLVQFDFSEAANDIRRQIGYKDDLTAMANGITAPYVPQAESICYYLLSNLGNYALRQPFYTYNTSAITGNILQVVDVDSSYGTIVKFVNTLPEFYEVDRNHTFNQLWFRLVDQNNNVID